MFNLDKLPDLNDLDLTIIFSEQSISELNKYIEDKIINTNDIEEIKKLIHKYLIIKIILYKRKMNKKSQKSYKQKRFKENSEKQKELISKKDFNTDLINLFRDDAINILKQTT